MSMEQTLGTLSVVLEARDKNLLDALARSRSLVKGLVVDLAGLAGIGLSVAGIYKGLSNVVEFGGQMKDLAVQSGESISNLIVFRQALEEAGVGAGRARFMLMQLQRTLGAGGKANAGVLSQLGLSRDALRKMGTIDAIEQISKGLSKIKTESEKTQILNKLFGRGGFMMKGFFEDPNAMEDVRKTLGGMPALIERNANSFDRIGDIASRVKLLWVGLFGGIMEGIAPYIDQIVNMMARVDFTSIGQKIGRFVATLIELFKKFSFGDILKNGFAVAISYLADLLKNVLLPLWKATVYEMASFLGTFAKGSMGPKLIEALGLGRTVENRFRNEAKAIAEIKKIPAGFKPSAFTEGIMGNFSSMWNEASKAADKLIQVQQGPAAAAREQNKLAAAVFAPAPLAIKGSAEAYRAELGITNDMKKLANNSDKQSNLLQQIANATRGTQANTEDIDLEGVNLE